MSRLNIWDVNGEYRILHFACDKKGEIRYYYSRNNQKHLTNHIKVLFFTGAMKRIPFFIKVRFSVILPTVHTVHRYLATALARSETRNKSKSFQNLSTNAITNAYFGTSVIPIERREQICHGNGNNSILPNVSLPHSCTECPYVLVFNFS